MALNYSPSSGQSFNRPPFSTKRAATASVSEALLIAFSISVALARIASRHVWMFEGIAVSLSALRITVQSVWPKRDPWWSLTSFFKFDLTPSTSPLSSRALAVEVIFPSISGPDQSYNLESGGVSSVIYVIPFAVFSALDQIFQFPGCWYPSSSDHPLPGVITLSLYLNIYTLLLS